jgi:hypothetical protein
MLDSLLPWTRTPQVYRLLGLVRKFGAERLEQACRRTLLKVVTPPKSAGRCSPTASATSPAAASTPSASAATTSSSAASK